MRRRRLHTEAQGAAHVADSRALQPTLQVRPVVEHVPGCWHGGRQAVPGLRRQDRHCLHGRQDRHRLRRSPGAAADARRQVRLVATGGPHSHDGLSASPLLPRLQGPQQGPDCHHHERRRLHWRTYGSWGQLVGCLHDPGLRMNVPPQKTNTRSGTIKLRLFFP